MIAASFKTAHGFPILQFIDFYLCEHDRNELISELDSLTERHKEIGMGDEETRKKVMVAIDDSEYSYYALRWALQNIESIKEAKVYILTVLPVGDIGYIYASTLGNTAPELVQSVQENQRKAAALLLEKAKNICAEYLIDVETIAEPGDPKEVIRETAQKYNVQLLVVGSRGLNAIKRAFLGSVSNYCVHNAKCPVLVVKKGT